MEALQGPPDRPPKPKGTEELQALQQRYNHSSSHLHTMSYGVSRPKMLKSRSQGDSIDTDGNVTVSSASYVRPPRVHQYEEIKPKLVYVDLDLDLGKYAKSRTAK